MFARSSIIQDQLWRNNIATRVLVMIVVQFNILALCRHFYWNFVCKCIMYANYGTYKTILIQFCIFWDHQLQNTLLMTGIIFFHVMASCYLCIVLLVNLMFNPDDNSQIQKSRGLILVTDSSYNTTWSRAWGSNYTHVNEWIGINHPYSNFNSLITVVVSMVDETKCVQCYCPKMPTAHSCMGWQC